MKTANKLFMVLAIALLIFSACDDKTETRPNPTIEFITEKGYASDDTTVFAGDTARVGFNCNWNGTDLLTAIKVIQDGSITTTFEYSPPVESAVSTFTLIKSGADEEKYTFELIDANKQNTSLSLTIAKENSGNTISELTNVTIGAQGNTTTGSFYDLNSNTVYFEADAFNNQSVIDILGVYDASNANHLASTDASFKDGQYDFSNWTTTNKTEYCKMNISVDQYDYIDGDQYLIKSFDGFVQDDRKRKAKNLKPNDIYVFKTEAGKYGILKVNSVDAGETGSVTFDAKIQE